MISDQFPTIGGQFWGNFGHRGFKSEGWEMNFSAVKCPGSCKELTLQKGLNRMSLLFVRLDLILYDVFKIVIDNENEGKSSV